MNIILFPILYYKNKAKIRDVIYEQPMNNQLFTVFSVLTLSVHVFVLAGGKLFFFLARMRNKNVSSENILELEVNKTSIIPPFAFSS
jgi:hypothetical protein